MTDDEKRVAMRALSDDDRARLIDVTFRNGDVRGPRASSGWLWTHTGGPADIIAWRYHFR